MRLAIVVQRYGLEVNGGAELEARQVAEHLLPYVQVEVLTTCACDYMSWDNYYPPGLDQVNEVPVRRFAIRSGRDVAAFNRCSENLLTGPHSLFDEMRWMALQGPDVPDLFGYIRAKHERHDLFLFFTYLYATTYVGLTLVPHKSILWPTAHDEPWIHLDLFRPLFNLPRGLIFNSLEEEKLVRALFHNHQIRGCVTGVGIEVPAAPPLPTVDGPYIVYLGRVDESKGCRELIEYFLRYKSQTRDPVKLLLIGSRVMPVPQHPDILTRDFIAGDERFGWIQKADLLVLPSRYESLSLVTLEAWALGVPVLVNGDSPVLRGHCERSQGGLYYRTEQEFVASLRLLRSDAGLRRRLGREGQSYVRRNYDWNGITKQHISFLREIYDVVYPDSISARG